MTWMPGGYNDWFSVRITDLRFEFKINQPATQLYKNFEDAADIAAQLLYREWGNKPLYLALSGGIDSECTARILVKNKIPFTPVILKIGTLNKLEVWYAEYWCAINNKTPLILEYSIDDFAKEIAKFAPKLKYIRNYNLTPILLIYNYVHQQGGSCIYAAGDINLDLASNQFFCSSLDFVSNLINAGEHPTAFFMFTPEIALSYINQFDTSKSEQLNKIKFYGVSPRPKIDYVESMKEVPMIKETVYKLYCLFKENSIGDQRHWYGTKEQIIQALSP